MIVSKHGWVVSGFIAPFIFSNLDDIKKDKLCGYVQ